MRCKLTFQLPRAGGAFDMPTNRRFSVHNYAHVNGEAERSGGAKPLLLYQSTGTKETKC